MTKIEAIVRPTMLDVVKAALDELGLHGVTVTHVMGSGKQRGRTQHYRGQEYVVNLLDKIKIETVVPDTLVDSVMNAIADAAGTGEIGDGKIFVYKVDNAMRIRTKETGEEAIK
jgi:nitrogen regulatory protein P-II 1